MPARREIHFVRYIDELPEISELRSRGRLHGMYKKRWNGIHRNHRLNLRDKLELAYQYQLVGEFSELRTDAGANKLSPPRSDEELFDWSSIESGESTKAMLPGVNFPPREEF